MPWTTRCGMHTYRYMNCFKCKTNFYRICSVVVVKKLYPISYFCSQLNQIKQQIKAFIFERRGSRDFQLNLKQLFNLYKLGDIDFTRKILKDELYKCKVMKKTFLSKVNILESMSIITLNKHNILD